MDETLEGFADQRRHDRCGLTNDALAAQPIGVSSRGKYRHRWDRNEIGMRFTPSALGKGLPYAVQRAKKPPPTFRHAEEP
jgi:hypothetical protein